MKKLILISLILVFSFTSFSQKGKWKKAQKNNTIESYQVFVRDYPNSEFNIEAEQKLVELEYRKVERENTIDGYKYFLENYKQNKFTVEATNCLMIHEFEIARTDNTVDAYREFMKKYPKSETFYESAKSRMNKIIYSEFKTANIKNNIKDYEVFIKNYPESNYVAEARNSVSAIREFEKTREINTIEAYIEFILKFPNTISAKNAYTELTKLKRQKEVKVNKTTMDKSILAFTQADKFTIPYEIKHPDDSTETIAEIFYIDERKDLLAFSFDCENCVGEALFQISSFDYLLWTSGATHVYKGKKVHADYKSFAISNSMKTKNDGRIISVGNSGSTIKKNEIEGWTIIGEQNDPLEFKIINGLGYVYIKGSGIVIAPDGKINNLGRLSKDKKPSLTF